jgi:hypothetical protein
MKKKLKEIIISKDEATFWLDKKGCWNNVHGEFEHKKIIDYFHASIKKDKDGYYLSQTNGNNKEKVYFHFEDTALFVFDVIKDKDIILLLNTKKKMKLKPRKLFIKDDNLYMQLGEERIKFNEKSLVKISTLIECDNDRYFIKVRNRRYEISKS